MFRHSTALLRLFAPRSLPLLALVLATLATLATLSTAVGAQDWTPPVDVALDTGFSPAWLRDSAGTLHVITQSTPGLGEAQLYHSYRPAGGGWSIPALVSHSLQVAGLPDLEGYRSLFEDASGVVHLLYETLPDELGVQQVWHRRLDTASPGGGWTAPVDVSRSPDAAAFLQAAMVDSEGTLHVLFEALPGLGTIQLFHTYREPGQPWSEPVQVSHSTQGAFFARPPEYHSLLEDRTGILHLLYETQPDVLGVRQIWHRTLDAGAPEAGWTTPADVSRASQPATTWAAMLDSQGALHVLFDAIPGFGTPQIFHTYRPADGAWSTPEQVSNAGFVAPGFPLIFEYRFLQEDAGGTLHLFYEAIPGIGVLQVWHRMLDTASPGDGWSAPVDVSKSPQPAFAEAVAVDSEDTVHLLLRALPGAPATQQLFYVARPADADWTAPVQVSHSTQGAHLSGLDPDFPDQPGFPGYAFFQADAADTLHLFYETKADVLGVRQLFHRKKAPADGGWSTPVNVAQSADPSEARALAIDGDRTLHLLVWSWEFGLAHTQRAVGGAWSTPQPVLDPDPGAELPLLDSHPFFADDGAGHLHLFFETVAGIWHSSRTVPVAAPGGENDLIFADGFESGDVSAWGAP